MNHISHFALWHTTTAKSGQAILPEMQPATQQPAAKPEKASWVLSIELTRWRIRIGLTQHPVHPSPAGA